MPDSGEVQHMSVLVHHHGFRPQCKWWLLRTVRMAGYLLPKHFLRGAPYWNVDLVPTPADSERAVEIPWVASAISGCFGLWLDIGYVYAEPRYWEAVCTKDWRRLLRFGYGFDLAEPGHVDPLPMHVVGDVVNYDFAALPRFDLITCVSTLEHVGCDNTRYFADAVRCNHPFAVQRRALQQLLSALTRRGCLLLSLPYGAFQDHGWFLQYDAAMVQTLTEVAAQAGKQLTTELYYQLTDEGWQRVHHQGLEAVTYRSEEGRAAAVALLEFGRRAGRKSRGHSVSGGHISTPP
jgi:hypothetical protein